MGLITVHQAALKTGLKKTQIIAAIRKKALPAKMLGAVTNKRSMKPLWHVEEADLEKFVNSLAPNDFRTYMPAEVRDTYKKVSIKKPPIQEDPKYTQAHRRLESLKDELQDQTYVKEVWE